MDFEEPKRTGNKERFTSAVEASYTRVVQEIRSMVQEVPELPDSIKEQVGVFVSDVDLVALVEDLIDMDGNDVRPEKDMDRAVARAIMQKFRRLDPGSDNSEKDMEAFKEFLEMYGERLIK